MAGKTIMVDTSILIDYYRKTDKSKTAWLGLVKQGYSFAISSVSKYEIYVGADPTQMQPWDEILQMVAVIPFDE